MIFKVMVMEYLSRNVGRRIAKRRAQKHLQQNELAEKLGISNNHLCEIERGNHNPSITLFVQICDILDASPDYFLMGNMILKKVPQRIADAMELCSEEDVDIILALIEHLIHICQGQNDDKRKEL
ncbi:MAG: XRE family transcriptional regulator [Subdoligranulum variabile]|nr:MAG: XRE family transcriptional regulator [Subdoligranulum variabile]